ncbi:transcription-repair coupling factor [Aureibacillus halotolerans]|uniref:Transcription-repair-coupling factor n=1 Tax=Aureibacillus halotolerans TaxID=1508390 RepID=A0A4R6TXJ2_9BACI|nr:transcription-repair coupling factor [Aureibacillus halotolerans]TDQ34225.1 transcription-repair coupling factor [Aureibacillus halotolerans]
MIGLRHAMLENKEVRSVIDGLDKGLREQMVAGLSGSSRSVMMASLYSDTKRSQLVITHNLFQAQKVYEDLQELIAPEDVYLYPVNELMAAEIAVASPELKAQRIETLNHLSQGTPGIYVVPVAGLRRLLPPPQLWKASQLHLKTGEDIDLGKALSQLVDMGYDRVGMVSAPGEFSLRGGILDVYPLTEEFPFRVELFDTEIDSIRYFQAEDQRSKEQVESLSIGPATEILLQEEHYALGAQRLEQLLTTSLGKMKNQELKKDISENTRRDIDLLKQKTRFPELYKYMSLLYPASHSFFDYLSDSHVLFMDEIGRIQEVSSNLEQEEGEWHTSLLQQGKAVSELSFSHTFQDLLSSSTTPCIYYSMFLRHVPHTNPQNVVNMLSKPMQDFHGQMNLLKTETDRWKENGYAVVFLGADDERIERLQRIMEDYQIDVSARSDIDALLSGQCQVVKGDLNAGFELSTNKIAVLTEKELFKKQTKKMKRPQKISNAERIKSYQELKVGDYVVHVNHGIGKYLGIETLEMKGNHKDYLLLRYSGDDKLYVPVDQIDQVQKFVGSEGKEPKVYKLGGNDWKKVKTRVRSSVQDIADDLIKIYAAREASKGFAFPIDGEEQQSFEAKFLYQETEDQLRAIEEIKIDMEKERPMDRLLCGDVGYGKTEVAIRAAFKAIMSEKQVAILVPTTILAQQHYETIKERFQDYPINIGLLSRFRTKKQQNETIKGLKQGSIDLVIGTHRLLSKDVIYHDLGLLIVDEEQRFGVTHKEKIKKLKANVDVLTLTATPIPRTLHMSMLGVRDLSVIETPPENRFPVQTYVLEYNTVFVKESIERELARGGQVYFLYNRVEDIERKAEEISMLVPEARVAHAHGKLTESQLETTMFDFLEGEYDVLVSTTIIETGVDIPNVNTLIVYNGDKMGLSQLYQLRGRVGRSNRVAYAYFTYHQDKILSEVAEKRLHAIKEFTELGSGFKIAMRDLSIRGAGNLLGAEQHGFIDSVGFDLYSQMLQDAIEERKHQAQPVEKEVEAEVQLDIDAYIPAAYIADERQKIDMYKRFKGVSSLEEIRDLQDEMIDRFGEFPKEVTDLFTVTRLRLLASQQQVEKIAEENGQLIALLTTEGTQGTNASKLFDFVSSFGRAARVGTEGQKIKLIVDPSNVTASSAFDLLERLIAHLSEVRREEVVQ